MSAAAARTHFHASPHARRLAALLLALALVGSAPAGAQVRTAPAAPTAQPVPAAREKPPEPPRRARPSEAIGPWLIGAGVLGMLAIWMMRRVRDA